MIVSVPLPEAMHGERRPCPAGPLTLSTTVVTSPDGMRIVLAEDASVPLVRLAWVSRGGSASDPAARSGLAALTASALRTDTATRSRARIVEDLDDLGADLVTGCTWDETFLATELLGVDLQAGLEILLDLSTRPTFPDAAVEALRARRIAERRGQRLRPSVLADEVLARALYGKSAYGRPILGDETELAEIRVPDVAAFHEKHHRPEASCLVVAGSFHRPSLVSLLGPLSPENAARREPFPAPVESPSARILVVDVQGVSPIELRFGWVAVPRTDPRFPSLRLLDAIFGDGAGGRLTNRLREHLGLTYHVRSRLASRHGPGPLVVTTRIAVEHVGTAVGAVLDELDRLRCQAIPAAELEVARRAAHTSLLRRCQSLHERAVALREAAFDADPGDCFERHLRGTEEIGPEELRSLGSHHLHPKDMVIVAVGPADPLREQLQTYSDASGIAIDILKFDEVVGRGQHPVRHIPTEGGDEHGRDQG